MVGGEAMTVATGAGVKKVLLFDDGSSRVDMGAPHFDTEVAAGGFRFLRVSMGNPHAVAFLESEAASTRWTSPRSGHPSKKTPSFPGRRTWSSGSRGAGTTSG